MTRVQGTPWILLLVVTALAPACGGDLIVMPGADEDDDGSSDGGGWDTGWGDDSGSTDTDTDTDTDGGDSGGDSGTAVVIGPGDLVVSEIMIDSSAVSDAQGEWVEIWNASDQAVPLSAVVIADEGVDFLAIDSAATVRPGRYAVLCPEPDSGLNGGVSCDASYHYNTLGDGFSLANGGDEVILATLDGTIIDRMSYTDSQVSPGAALGVRPAALDAGGNDAASAWCPQTTLLPGGDRGTPGQQNDGC